MSYRFPEYTYDVASIVDPEMFRRAISPAWEEMVHLGEHNIVANTFGNSQRGTHTFYDFHYDSEEINTGLRDDAPTQYYPLAGSGIRVNDSGEWQEIMPVSYTCSDDRVWAIGWAQYGIVDTSFSVGENPESKARIQFAISVNDVIQEGSITGKQPGSDPGEYYTGRGQAPINATLADSYTTDCRVVQQVAGPGFHVGCVRLQWIGNTPAGTATVKLMARRSQPAGAQTTGSSTPVYVFSHKLLCVQIKDGPERDDALTQVDPQFPEFGDIYNAASLNTTMDNIADGYNDLYVGNILTEGLRAEHLNTTQVVSALQATITPAAVQSSTTVYPGWGTDGETGWDSFDDGAGNFIQCTGPFNYTTTPAFVLILSNVNVTLVTSTTTPATTANYAAICINEHFVAGSGAEQALSQTNSPNLESTSDDLVECNIDIPMLDWRDYRSAPPGAGQVAYYRLNCAAIGSGTPTLSWTNGSMQCIHFHP